MNRIKTINSHVGLARWLSETSEEPIGYLARIQVEGIPSPYAYSPTKDIWDWNGRKVVWFETRHKHYEIFEVPPHMLHFDTEEAACEYHIRFSRKPHLIAPNT